MTDTATSDNVTRYTVFEEDQVLTSLQLNEIVTYLDGQDRETRTKLIGVGIVCGLRPSRAGNPVTVTVTKGAGVTTHGDLLFLEADRTYDRFKPYDGSAYPPLPKGTVELLRAGSPPDGQAKPLSQYAGGSLDGTVAVLFMESAEKDPDLCMGGDCDNLGKWSCHTQRLLLVPNGTVGSLLETMPTPRVAGATLKPVVAERPIMSATIVSSATLADRYRAACNQTLADLAPQLMNVFHVCGTLLPDVFPTDPTPSWSALLKRFQTDFAITTVGIQYYYDFLKDLVETYNALRHLLREDTTVCCPDADAFPQHLVLGNLVAGADPDANRTGRYPSPIVSATVERWSHAKALARKLDAEIQSFRSSVTSAAEIRITPSRFEESSLEDRAIPFYYQPGGAIPIERAWSFDLTQVGMAAYNYSYNAPLYGALGGAADPFTAQIGPFPFFRIEGHLLKPVSSAVTSLQNEIRSKNLPFAVRAVLLGVDRGQILFKPPARYTDLHRIHYLLRQDVVHQLDDVMQATSALTGQVNSSVGNEPDAPALKAAAAQQSATIMTKAATAKAKLNVSYPLYRQAPSWRNDVSDTMIATGLLKADLTSVLKTDYVTPYDTLIGATHVQWLDWLDGIIQATEDKAADGLLFSRFITDHPGLEHFAGVVRGGTFVLAYDSTGMVVADFMLPYYCPDRVEAADPEPGQPQPGIRTPDILLGGWRVIPSVGQVVKTGLDAVRAELAHDFVSQTEYTKLLGSSLTALFGTIGSAAPGSTSPGGGVVVRQPPLASKVVIMTTKATQVATLTSTLNAARDPAARAAISTELTRTQGELADAITEVARITATDPMGVAPGSDGYNALLAASHSAASLSDAAAIAKATKELATVAATAPPAARAVIGSIASFLATR